MKHITKLATHNPMTVIEDILGLSAICIIVMIGLHIPNFY